MFCVPTCPPVIRWCATSRLWGAIAKIVFFLTIAIHGPVARAHSGHDHGDQKSAVTTAGPPRITARSELYELVGVLDGDKLLVHLHLFESNEPVTDAALSVTIGNTPDPITAERTSSGVYVISSPQFSSGSGARTLDLIFAISAEKGDDLLIGNLMLPEVARQPPAPSPTSTSPELLSPQGITNFLPWASGRISVDPLIPAALLLGFLFGLVGRHLGKSRRLVPTAALTLAALLAMTGVALGHEGHVHGTQQAPLQIGIGDRPQRLPDGTVFLPKATQRLLEIRTAIVRIENVRKAINLIGRVIADPNRSSFVQSITGGRVIAAKPPGLPRVGQQVSLGEVLAQIERPLPPEEQVNLTEKSGEIEQMIAVAETKLKRARLLAEKNVTPRSQVIDAEVELEGLRRRRDIIRATRIEAEPLRASTNGIIVAARIAPGQVVQAQDVLFQIVDPKSLWVEALVFGDLDPASLGEATATLGASDVPLRLSFQGFSRALQQQAAAIQFAIADPPSGLSVGQSVTVIATSGAAGSGLVLPRGAVVRGRNGESIVWHLAGAERLEAKTVRTEPFDATRLRILSGIAEGERIVVRGAELVNQVR